MIKQFQNEADFEGYKIQLQREKEEYSKRFEADKLKEANGEIRSRIVAKSYVDGSRYKGQFFQGKRHGVGIYYYSNGDVYGGQWSNDLFDGYGFYIFNSGERYEGELKNGKKHGKGKYYYINGSIYDGSWAFDNKNGVGKYYYLKTGGKLID